jgi:prepilin peptidase CpaA
LLGVVGGGDLKLFAALGAFLGPADIITAFIMTAITGGFYAIVLAMASGRLKETCTGVFNKLKAFLFTREPSCLRHDQDSVSGELKLYYGVAIAFGTLLSVFYKS